MLFVMIRPVKSMAWRRIFINSWTNDDIDGWYTHTSLCLYDFKHVNASASLLKHSWNIPLTFRRGHILNVKALAFLSCLYWLMKTVLFYGFLNLSPLQSRTTQDIAKHFFKASFDNHTPYLRLISIIFCLPEMHRVWHHAWYCIPCHRLIWVDHYFPNGMSVSVMTTVQLLCMMTSSNGKISALLALCQWRGALMFSFICAWTNGWVNNRDAGDLRCHRAH